MCTLWEHTVNLPFSCLILILIILLLILILIILLPLILYWLFLILLPLTLYWLLIDFRRFTPWFGWGGQSSPEGPQEWGDPQPRWTLPQYQPSHALLESLQRMGSLPPTVNRKEVPTHAFHGRQNLPRSLDWRMGWSTWCWIFLWHRQPLRKGTWSLNGLWWYSAENPHAWFARISNAF